MRPLFCTVDLFYAVNNGLVAGLELHDESTVNDEIKLWWCLGGARAEAVPAA